MILRHIVGSDKRDGFYIDIGAYDPVLFSNTYFFYLNGWNGINIEARPGSRAAFQKVRPRDTNLEMGISRSRGELTYYLIGEDSTMNSFSRPFLEQIGMLGEVKQEIQVPVEPLADVLAKHLPERQVVDFMNVDVEGHGLEVLESNNWERFRPRLLVLEDEEVDLEKSAVVKLMRGHDYDVCAQNVIILGKINEYFLIDNRWRRTLEK